MSEYRKQAAFLKNLLAYSDNEDHLRLQEQLAQAEKNERCLLCACRLVGLIACFGLAGLGYSAVLLPQFFHNSSHFLVQFFCALGLGSSMCLLVFVGLWLYYRGSVNRVHEECRRAIVKILEARLILPDQVFQPTVVEDPDLQVSAIRFITHTESASLSMRKAS